MTLQAVKSIAETVCLLAVAGSAVFLAYDTHQTQNQVRDALGSANVAIQSLDSTLEAVNRPCSPGPCGTLAEANKTMVKAQDVTVTLQKQVSQSSELVNSASASLTSAAGDVHTMALAGVGTAQAATDALGTAQTSIQSFQPLLTHADATMVDLDNLVLDPGVKETIENVDGVTANLAASTGDFQKRFHLILFPPPCKTFGCRFARYVYPAMKDGAALGSDLYWTGQVLGRTVPVRIQH